MSGQAHQLRRISAGYRGLMLRRWVVIVLIGVVMGGCLSPNGTVKVDGAEYAKAVKETGSLFRDATDLIRETSAGTEGDISGVQSLRCGEPFGDNLRKLQMGASFLYDGTSSEAEIIDSVAGDLAERGWKKKQGEDGTYRYEHGIPGGATLKLYVTLSGNPDEQGRSSVRMSAEGTCMDIPKDIAEKT